MREETFLTNREKSFCCRVFPLKKESFNSDSTFFIGMTGENGRATFGLFSTHNLYGDKRKVSKVIAFTAMTWRYKTFPCLLESFLSSQRKEKSKLNSLSHDKSWALKATRGMPELQRNRYNLQRGRDLMENNGNNIFRFQRDAKCYR